MLVVFISQLAQSLRAYMGMYVKMAYIPLYVNGMSEWMIPSLTGSLTGTKRESLYGDVGQDGLFIFSYT